MSVLQDVWFVACFTFAVLTVATVYTAIVYLIERVTRWQVLTEGLYCAVVIGFFGVVLGYPWLAVWYLRPCAMIFVAIYPLGPVAAG